jgi:hypothetical protein
MLVKFLFGNCKGIEKLGNLDLYSRIFGDLILMLRKFRFSTG